MVSVLNWGGGGETQREGQTRNIFLVARTNTLELSARSGAGFRIIFFSFKLTLVLNSKILSPEKASVSRRMTFGLLIILVPQL